MQPLIHAFRVLGAYFAYDACTNALLPLSREQGMFAREIEEGNPSPQAEEFLKVYQKQGYFLPPEIKEIRHPEVDALPYHLDRKIKQLTLQVTRGCNLNCSYCAYSGIYENRTHENRAMPFDVAKKAIDYLLRHSIDEPSITLAFYGGEPLLEIELVERCIQYMREKAAGRKYSFSMTTNGTLLTPEIYKRLADNDVSILISLDGPKAVHDTNRKFTDGSGSFDVIVNNIEAIQAQYPEAKDKLRFLAVASPFIEDACLSNLYRMDEIMPYYGVTLSFMSETYTSQEIKYSDDFSSLFQQEKAKLYLYMLGKLDKKYVSRLLLGNEAVMKKTFLQLKRRMKKMPYVCHPGGPCLAGVQRPFVSVNGIFYPCERVSEESQAMNMGDVDSGIDVQKAIEITNIGAITGDECKKCWAFHYCKMCAAYADDLSGFSSEKRLAQCNAIRLETELQFREVCFLKQRGYNFYEGAEGE